ncbi:TRADD-N-associated membrane domain-containing protein [Desulfitobacterium metallireducens]
MFLFILVIVFIFFSGQLEPAITMTITGILLGIIFIYRARSKKR